MLGGEPLRRARQFSRWRVEGIGARDRLEHRLDRMLAEERRREPLALCLERPPRGEGDHGLAGRVGLHRHDSELLRAGKHECPAALDQLGDRVVVEAPVEGYGRARQLLQVGKRRPRTDEVESEPGPVRRAHDQLHPLVGEETREDEQALARGCGAKRAVSTGGKTTWASTP